MKGTLESLLTRIPLYVLTIGALTTLISLAFICALLGFVHFSPVALIASSAVFSLVAVGASWGFGKLYGVHSHLQSALITAHILTLLFTPSTEMFVLAKYALIAVIAIASKFVVTYKQRHIFNPAAFGAFVGGLLGLSYASWWIGSPPFIIAVAIAAFAVLYKTRQLTLGLLFIAVSAVLITISGTLHGEPLQSMLLMSVTSWPIVFLAGFMLSEPLTQPPRRWQKLSVAVVVAVVTSIPFHVGWFNSSPAFALLMGNALAFILGFRQRKGLQLRFKERRPLASSIQEYVFTTSVPVQFHPGQYIELTLPHAKPDMRGIRRSFSLTSNPGEQEIRLGVKFYDSSSSFKKSLQALSAGSVVQNTGITGDFVLPAQTDCKLLLVAAGIGVTPFISQIRSVACEDRDITLLYFARSPAEIAYREFLDTSNISVHYFVAEDEKSGYIQGSSLTSEILQKFVPDLAVREVYISGPPAMVAANVGLIGKKARKVHTDYFSGY